MARDMDSLTTGGSTDVDDVLLVALPFPQSRFQDVWDRVQANHPRMRILYFELISDHEWKLWQSDDASIPLEYFAQATVMVTLRALPLPAQAPKLQLVHLFSAGINHITHTPFYKDCNIPLTTSSGIHTTQITEHVFMTLLAVTHHLKLVLSWQAEKRWGAHRAGGYFSSIHDLVGQRIGILGYGSIGRQAANVAKALGMEVIAYTASPRETPESRKDSGYIIPGTGDPDGLVPSKWFSGLDAASRRNFLAQGIDVLLVSVPLTDDTHHFLSTEEFEILSRPRPNGRKGAFVINIARGPIIDHDAMIKALKRGLDKEDLGGLTGASLDVTEPEPLPDGHELWGLENVIVSPHVAGVGSSYAERCLEILEINLQRKKEGQKPINLVDRKRGY